MFGPFDARPLWENCPTAIYLEGFFLIGEVRLMNNSDPLTSPFPCSQVLQMLFPNLIIGNGLTEVLLITAFSHGTFMLCSYTALN